MILVETHVVVWLAFDRERISRRARAAIDDAREHSAGLAIFDITLFKPATLVNKSRVRLEISLESFLQEVGASFVVLPISDRARVRAMGLPELCPKDPADRILGATAMVEGAQTSYSLLRRLCGRVTCSRRTLSFPGRKPFP